MPTTQYVVLVDRVLKGSIDETAVLRVPGGRAPNGLSLAIAGAPAFREGDRALVFLAERGDGTYGILHFALGAFHRVASGATAALAVRDLSDATNFGTRGEAVAEPARDYQRFANWLSDRARGVKRPLDYVMAPSAQSRSAIVERFALFEDGGLNYRWFEFDSGGAVAWGFNGDLSADPARDHAGFLQALAVWNDDPGSNVNYAFIGDVGPDSFPESDGSNGIVFEDPNNEIEGSFDCGGGGTVAIGGILYDGSTARFAGRTYVRILEGGIVFQDGLECLLAGNPSLSAEIATHELGHTLGISHSCGDSGHCARPAQNDAIMRAMVHDDGRGARLGVDDRNAAAQIYPAAAGAGGGSGGAGLVVPSGVTATPVSPTAVLVTWQDNSDTETRFRVEYTLRRKWLTAGLIAPNTTELLVGGLPSGATVKFRISAERRRASSGYSEVVATTLP